MFQPGLERVGMIRGVKVANEIARFPFSSERTQQESSTASRIRFPLHFEMTTNRQPRTRTHPVIRSALSAIFMIIRNNAE